MRLKPVISKDNPVFQGLLDLAQHRQARQQLQRTLLDGEHLVEEALLAGHRPLRLVFADGYDGVERWAGRLPEVPMTSLPEGLFRRLSAVQHPTGMLAEIAIPGAQMTTEPRFAMFVEAVQDPGNLGALMRCAAAADVDRVCLSPGCAEAWSPKTLRGGQGAQFHLDIRERVDLAAAARAFRGGVYAALPGASRSLFSLDLGGPCAFVFGNEGTGLVGEVLAHAEPFSIPMPGRAESLNVAAAAAVCLFERVRQGLAGGGRG